MNDKNNEIKRLRDRLDQVTSENQLINAAFEHMPQALCMFDSGQRLIFANKRYADMYRIPHEDLAPGTELKDIVQMRLKNGIFAGDSPDAYIKERAQWGSAQNRSEAVHQLSDGRIIAIKRQLLPDGGWLATHTDISEQLTLKQELQHSTERYKELLETLNVVPWEYDCAANAFVYIGPQAAQFGYPVSDWYQADFWPTVIHPDDRDEAVKFCQTATEKGEDHDFEYRMIRADGSECWIRDIVTVVTNEDKSVGLRGIFIDISHRKQIEHALRGSEGRFKDIAETATDWFWETDEEHRFTYLSKRFTDVTGVGTDVVVGRTRADFAQNAGGALDEHLADLKAQRSFRDFRYVFKNELGKTYYWSISGRPFYDQDGTFRGYRGSGKDRTAEERAKQEVIRSRNRLQQEVAQATTGLRSKAQELERALENEQQLVAVQRQFIAMASHEFRTPLAVIDGSIQRLLRHKDKLTTDTLESRAKKIRKAVATMTSLMESTLSAARMDAGKITIETQNIEIGAMIAEVCERQRDFNDDLVITCDLDDLPDHISGDLGALEQVFTNLLTNAVKYSPNDPRVCVKGWRDGAGIIVSVQDHGVGIDEDDLPNMFNRFFRAKTSTGIAGTGIGLNLAKSVIDLHEGRITVASTKGQGSVFTVYLPIAGPSQCEQSTSAVA